MQSKNHIQSPIKFELVTKMKNIYIFEKLLVAAFEQYIICLVLMMSDYDLI